jgi:enediyne biosynthesis protein E4
LEASDWTWAPVFLDVDLDGYEDLLVVTGHERDAQNIDVARHLDSVAQSRRMPHLEQLNLRQMFPRLDTPNFAFRNQGNLRFTEQGADWGFDSRRISQGIALVDLDGDGDQDVVINCLNDGPLVYRNDATQPRVSVRLAGRPPNTQGIGARITVRGAGFPEQSQEIMAGGRYLSSDDPSRTFAVQPAPATSTISVTWRSGRRSVISNAAPNRVYRVIEPGDDPWPQSRVEAPEPLFAEVSGMLGHVHEDAPFDDFQRQPLLPRRLGGLGPGVSWQDLDGDGRDDLLVGGGRGGRMAGWRNDAAHGFVRLEGPGFDAPLERDQTTLLAWEPQPGNPVVVWGAATYEDLDTASPALQSLHLGSGTIGGGLTRHLASVGPLALGDADGDGDLDLFVGGRAVAGRYPEAAASVLLRNEEGMLRPDSAVGEALGDLGMVSGAVWTDVTGDGRAELVLALEWGTLRVLRFEANAVVDLTESLGLNKWVGWWNSVTAGDFDGDGRMDLAAGNWGRNTRYEAYLDGELHLYFGELTGDSYFEVIDAYRAPELGKIVPWRDWQTLGQSLPWLLERYRSFTEFSTVSVDEMLGQRRHLVRRHSANTLDSMVFLNRAGGFEARPLPMAAQISPVFGLAVADFDGDGREDLVVTQNFFPVSADASRLDAGGTLLLRGDGTGGFEAVTTAASGLRSYGEGRGIAVADFDQDGRPDLVVGQNSSDTKMFRNAAGRPGLRVRLEGPADNARGVGAVLRPIYEGTQRLGPAREVRAGGGYWSQDSAAVVLGQPAPIESLEVRWPGGLVQRMRVPKGAGEVRVRFEER